MNTIILMSSQPPIDSGDAGVGIIWLIVFGVLGWIIFGKHDDSDRGK